MAAYRTIKSGFLYPDPPIHDEFIIAVVVEKKGDETRTSMRQSEIYAYSNEIIIRDGYMVMPKICWNEFEPGEWFICEREFSKCKDGQPKEERELKNLQKIEKVDYERFEIPPTKVNNGNVFITRPFVICPNFIRNNTIRNSYGTYTKVLLMNIGQGFIHNRNQSILKKIKPGMVYIGTFEFHAKDNGAVNFAPRTEIKDFTNHVLERDAMWELIELDLQKEGVPVSEHKLMKDDLEDLHKYAKLHENILLEKGYYGKNIKAAKKPDETVPQKADLPNVSLPKSGQMIPEFKQLKVNRSEDVNRDRALVQKVQNLGVGLFEERRFANGQRADNANVSVSSNLAQSGNLFPIIRNREELEEHRARTIVRAPFQSGGSLQQKWVDQETGDSAVMRNLLNPDWTLSNISVADRLPLASSTPRTSPQMNRRAAHLVGRTQPQSPASSLHHYNANDTFVQNTTAFSEVYRDNNANPGMPHPSRLPHRM